VKLDEANRLLDPAPMPLETGYERLADGVLHIACRTDLHGCTGEMFEWWFRFRPDTQKYIWWHPVDHTFSDWIGGDGSTHVGSIHKVEEYFTGIPAERLLIQFRESTEFFDAEAYATAREEGRLTASVCGRVGFGWDAPTLPDGRILGGRLLHIGRDTAWGCALRSHFFIGQDLPAAGKGPEEVAAIATDAFACALLQHCYNEFTFLSRFLPSLFIAENRKTHAVRVPW
jgi:DAPG hydrolase PhiG domain